MDRGIGAIVGIFTAIFGVAMVAILISQKAQTASIIQALAAGTGTVLQAATAPVTGTGQ